MASIRTIEWLFLVVSMYIRQYIYGTIFELFHDVRHIMMYQIEKWVYLHRRSKVMYPEEKGPISYITYETMLLLLC